MLIRSLTLCQGCDNVSIEWYRTDTENTIKSIYSSKISVITWGVLEQLGYNVHMYHQHDIFDVASVTILKNIMGKMDHLFSIKTLNIDYYCEIVMSMLNMVIILHYTNYTNYILLYIVFWINSLIFNTIIIILLF